MQSPGRTPSAVEKSALARSDASPALGEKSALARSDASPALGERRARRLHRFACLTAASTLMLIVAGGLVTSTGSGLAVPDWPLSYGQLMPPMVGGIFYEHGHRMVAGAVAVLTLLLAIWLVLREPRRWVWILGLIALAAVIVQAILGGMTVLLLLPAWISVTHACLAQTFFCLTVTIALVTSARWRNEPLPENSDPHTRTLSLLAFCAVYAQLVVGAIMRHSGAGLAIPDFPLAFGRLIPPYWSSRIAVAFTHRAGAMLVLGIVIALVVRILRTEPRTPDLVAPSIFLAALLPIQVALGGLTVLTGKAVLPATAHVATGALVLGTTLILTMRAQRTTGAVRLAARESVGSTPGGRSGRAELDGLPVPVAGLHD